MTCSSGFHDFIQRPTTAGNAMLINGGAVLAATLDARTQAIAAGDSDALSQGSTAAIMTFEMLTQGACRNCHVALGSAIAIAIAELLCEALGPEAGQDFHLALLTMTKQILMGGQHGSCRSGAGHPFGSMGGPVRSFTVLDRT